MEQWKPYFRDRLIKQRNNFYVIVPNDAEPNVPLFCPVCETLMRTRDDETAWLDLKCCHRCSMAWAAPRRKEWQEGWRPDHDILMREVAQRPPLSVKFEVD
jgi:hypothetical protein